MSEFINTIDLLGDDAVIDSIIDRSITEFKDDVITKMGDYAFYSCKALETVDLPNVTTLYEHIFENCTSLKNVNLPKAVSTKSNTSGSRFFYGCSSLKRITLHVTRLYNDAFRNCSALQYVDLTKCSAFNSSNFYGCTKLIALLLRNNSVCNAAYVNCTNTAISAGTGYIYVPRALIEDYKVATNWSTYANQFRALEDYTVDGTTTGELDYGPCTGISLSASELTFTDANPQTLTAVMTPKVVEEGDVVWTSSKPLVAVVKNGVITPKIDGECVITATCGDYSATCNVTVNAGLDSAVYLYEASNGLSPEECGFTPTISGNATSVLKDEMLHLTAATSAYVKLAPIVATANMGIVRSVFKIISFASDTGYRIQISNGTSGGQIRAYKDGLYYDNAGTFTKIATLNNNTLYEVIMEFDGTTVNVYLNGEQIYTTTTLSTSWCTSNATYQQNGGETAVQSLEYVIIE